MQAALGLLLLLLLRWRAPWRRLTEGPACRHCRSLRRIRLARWGEQELPALAIGQASAQWRPALPTSARQTCQITPPHRPCRRRQHVMAASSMKTTCHARRPPKTPRRTAADGTGDR
jgi:hypothetical protein